MWATILWKIVSTIQFKRRLDDCKNNTNKRTCLKAENRFPKIICLKYFVVLKHFILEGKNNFWLRTAKVRIFKNLNIRHCCFQYFHKYPCSNLHIWFFYSHLFNTLSSKYLINSNRKYVHGPLTYIFFKWGNAISRKGAFQKPIYFRLHCNVSLY